MGNRIRIPHLLEERYVLKMGKRVFLDWVYDRLAIPHAIAMGVDAEPSSWLVDMPFEQPSSLVVEHKDYIHLDIPAALSETALCLCEKDLRRMVTWAAYPSSSVAYRMGTVDQRRDHHH
jgi:hypothetical protein